MSPTFRVGLIADTHGLLRPQALDALRGSDAIVHAGDIGSAQILQALAEIAPVTAVRGNNDTAPWARVLPHRAALKVGDVVIDVIHDLAEFEPAPGAAQPHAVISGHSHRPRVQRQGQRLYVNPGSAGPRRFRLPVSVGRLTVSGTSVCAEVIELTC